MNHIIDGHNLIAKMPGLDLSMPDDEARLIEVLGRYCQVGGHQVEVYFDAAPLGQVGAKKYGKVRAHFIAQRSSADEAISRRVRQLGKAAKNWRVVTSDRRVQAAAHEVQAEVMEADEFARRVISTLHEKEEPTKSTQQLLSEAEVKEWEAVFRGKGKPEKK